MTGLLVVLLLAAGLAPYLLLRRLRTLSPAAVARPGSVSVVVPARDEAGSLPTLLASLGRQTVPLTDVVVVDDGSTDGTAAVARRAGATVLTVAGPPPGWTGKAWACQVGADATSGSTLVFLDADTELAPAAVAGLLGLLDEAGGLVSVQPFHAVTRPYEQLSAYFNAVSVLASGAFGGHPERRPMAFGPGLATSRADYRTAGGHAAVRADVLDDVALARAYARAGRPVRCVIGGTAVRMRMYPRGPRQLAEGWTKNIASGAGAAAPGPTVAAVGWVAAHHAVAVGGLLTLVDVFVGLRLAVGPPALWAAAWVGLALQLRWLLGRLGSFRWWTWALFPVPLLAFDLLFARSAVLTVVHRSVRWRGRDVPLDHAPAGDG